MHIVKIALAVGLALAVGVGTGYAANTARGVPAGAVNLIVQPDTHFDVTCADGSQLGIVTDGASAGSGYCAPLESK